MWFLWSCIGVAIGSIISNIIFYWRTGFGTLNIDHSNPDKDVYRFEIEDLDDLYKKSKVVMSIKHRNTNSQK